MEDWIILHQGKVLTIKQKWFLTVFPGPKKVLIHLIKNCKITKEILNFTFWKLCIIFPTCINSRVCSTSGVNSKTIALNTFDMFAIRGNLFTFLQCVWIFVIIFKLLELFPKEVTRLLCFATDSRFHEFNQAWFSAPHAEARGQFSWPSSYVKYYPDSLFQLA